MSRRTELSAHDAQQALQVLELFGQFQQLRRAYAEDGDALALAEGIRQVDLAALDEAHAWLARLLVDRYAGERITLDTGKFRIPAFRPIKA
jgi:hypothetical protein